MRLKRHACITIMGAAVGLVLTISYLHYQNCASNNDKYIKQYLTDLFIGQNVIESSNALKHIGSKAGPHLLKLCKTEVYRPINKKLPLIRQLFYEHPEKYQLAVEGYIILGPELKDTVPELYRIIKYAEQTDKPNHYARTCFYSIGRDATRYLVHNILYGNRDDRDFAWKMLESMDQIYEEDLEMLIRKYNEFTVVQKMRLLNFMAFAEGIRVSDKQFIYKIAEDKEEDEDLKKHAELTLEIMRTLEKERLDMKGFIE